MVNQSLPDILPAGTHYKCNSGEFELLEPSARHPKSEMPWSEEYPCVRRRRVSTGEEYHSVGNSWIAPEEAVFTLPAQRFYDKQPEVLPKTLPTGTLTRDGNEAASLLLLRPQSSSDGLDAYWGRWGRDKDACVDSYYRAGSIDWTSVPIVDTTPESEADRPIQAGDWVECIDQGTGLIVKNGERYLVEGLSGQNSLVVHVSGNSTSVLWTCRFKRVAGPHPADIDPEPAPLHAGADNGVSASDCRRCGEVPCICDNPVRAAEPRFCPECPTELTPQTIGNDPYCVECTKRRQRAVAGPSDPYRDHNFRKQPDKGDIHNRSGNVAARARLAAWELAEKPRVANSAERKSLAAGHPSTWPSVGDDEP